MRNVVVLFLLILTAAPSPADTAAAWAALHAGKAVGADATCRCARDRLPRLTAVHGPASEAYIL